MSFSVLLLLFADSAADESGLLCLLLTILLVGSIAVGILADIVRTRGEERRTRALQISNIDCMTGIEFELYLQKLLSSRGYKVTMTQSSGDLGVDLIAGGRDVTTAIQVKRATSKVSRRAVSDVVAGMQHYGCTRAMVITNWYFARGAQTLARSTNCILIDRDTLCQWIIEFQKTARARNPTH